MHALHLLLATLFIKTVCSHTLFNPASGSDQPAAVESRVDQNVTIFTCSGCAHPNSCDETSVSPNFFTPPNENNVPIGVW
jgi:hypothetical protein